MSQPLSTPAHDTVGVKQSPHAAAVSPRAVSFRYHHNTRSRDNQKRPAARNSHATQHTSHTRPTKNCKRPPSQQCADNTSHPFAARDTLQQRGSAHSDCFIDGLALPLLGRATQQQRTEAADATQQPTDPPPPLSLSVLAQPDIVLRGLLLPLIDCLCGHPARESAIAATGTCCALMPSELLRTVDQHLHVVLHWLRDGCLEKSRPSLNCNTGVAVKDQMMAFYLSSRFMQTQPAPDPRHYTLWATASEYEWSELLIQPTFRRQQTTYALAVQQSADMNEVMRGYEGSVLDIINRLALVLHADGLIPDDSCGANRVRRILPMSYFEVSAIRCSSAVVQLSLANRSMCCLVVVCCCALASVLVCYS